MPLKFWLTKRFAWLMAVLLVVLSIADVSTTIYLLAQGGREGNFSMAWLLNVFGNWAFVIKVLITAGIGIWLVKEWKDYLAKITMGIAIMLHCVVVGRHLYYILGDFV